MIVHLKGTVEKIQDNSVVIDVNGIGYHVICSAKTIGAIGGVTGVSVHLFIEMVIREDAWILYGFASDREKFWFNTLTAVQGVGGKAAISILSALSDDEIYNAFLAGDKNAFTRADGVGPKLASRIISELKEKVVGKISAPVAVQMQMTESSVLNDVISALTNLGYQKSDIYKATSATHIDENIKFDTLLRQILNKLSNGI
jgi:Holliday junction DNA helicase RuvA